MAKTARDQGSRKTVQGIDALVPMTSVAKVAAKRSILKAEKAQGLFRGGPKHPTNSQGTTSRKGKGKGVTEVQMIMPPQTYSQKKKTTPRAKVGGY